MASSTPATVSEPFPIFTLANRYLVYDIATVSHIRAAHNIPGVLIGLLPQAPQQNIFSGLPLELIPEEARVLCEKGVAYIVDDVRAHKQGFLDREMSEEERRTFREGLRRQGVAAARQVREKADGRKLAAMQRRIASGGDVGDWNDLPEEMLRPASRAGSKRKKGRPDVELGDSRPATPVGGADVSTSSSAQNGHTAAPVKTSAADAEDEDDSLFGSPMNSFPAKPLPDRSRAASGASHTIRPDPPPYGITPTTSYPPLKTPLPPPPRSRPSTPNQSRPATPSNSPPPINNHTLAIPAPPPFPEVPASYPLYAHLHAHYYFLLPGLRFGCQYTAYPGDPLRFHSHFLCKGLGWEEEFDLLDLVAGGRMGTGVKKGWLLGGEEEGAAVGRSGRGREAAENDGKSGSAGPGDG
ncbi:tRNA-splicing endonuclease subunit, partial [Teratosphaeriaceae sp. CCFEE 6253]